MAKTNKFIFEYREKMSDSFIDFDNIKPPKKTMKRFIRLLKDVDDGRMQGMVEYPIEEVIVIAFLAVLGNASTWSEIPMFGKAHQKWLKKFLKLENGIPVCGRIKVVLTNVSWNLDEKPQNTNKCP